MKALPVILDIYIHFYQVNLFLCSNLHIERTEIHLRNLNIKRDDHDSK